jgi:hypothetical protein
MVLLVLEVLLVLRVTWEHLGLLEHRVLQDLLALEVIKGIRVMLVLLVLKVLLV